MNAKIGLPGLLGLIFITLKLLGKISWPWLWVLSPLWGGLALASIIFVAIFVVALIFGSR